MARPLRIEFESAVHHVTSRGNGRADIYLCHEDREIFLETLTQVVARFGWICHAFCLMGNHYHLLIETPKANLSHGMRQLNGVYTQRFNRAHDRVGHLFQGRFKSIVVDKEAYLLALSRYIVRNPVAAGWVAHVSDWPWSSYQATVGETEAPPFLHVDWLLSQFGTVLRKAQSAYARFVADHDQASPWEQLNGPNILGSDDFRARLQTQAGSVSREIPKRKRQLRHLPLDEIATQERERGEWMREAYQQHGYTLQQIADHAGLHYSTVSRSIKSVDDDARNKT
jgi:putative transposase